MRTNRSSYSAHLYFTRHSVGLSESRGPQTEAEARKRLEWRDMGQRDNTKRLQLSFQDADGRPMTYGTLTKDTGAKAWTVADSDGWRHSLLTAAKKKAEDLAIERLRKDGYVTKDREVVDTSKDKRIGTDINGKPVFEGSDGSLKGIPYTFDERGKVRTGVAMQEQDQQFA